MDMTAMVGEVTIVVAILLTIFGLGILTLMLMLTNRDISAECTTAPGVPNPFVYVNYLSKIRAEVMKEGDMVESITMHPKDYKKLEEYFEDTVRDNEGMKKWKEEHKGDIFKVCGMKIYKSIAVKEGQIEVVRRTK